MTQLFLRHVEATLEPALCNTCTDTLNRNTTSLDLKEMLGHPYDLHAVQV